MIAGFRLNPGRHLVTAAVGWAVLALYLGGLTNNRADYDLWGYLAFGRLFWTTGFPYHDVFSYVPTKDLWVYHEWLTGVLFYPIHEFWGSTGLQIVNYGLGLSTIGLIYAAARQRGAEAWAAVAALYLGQLIIPFGYGPVRAQVFTYFFFALTLFILEKAEKKQSWSVLWLLIPIQVAWANLHGGFLAGLGLMFLDLVANIKESRGRRFRVLVLTTATLVTLINPYGLEYWRYSLEAVTMPRPDIDEWHGVFRLLGGGDYRATAIFFLVMASLTAVLFIWRRHRNPRAVLILATVLWLGISHVRHVVFFALAFVVFVPVVLSEAGSMVSARLVASGRSRWLTIGRLAIILFLFTDSTVYLVRQWCRTNPLELATLSTTETAGRGNDYPVQALAYMKANGLKGRILPQFEWGEYITWKTHPDNKVAMDGRFETVYPSNVANDYFDFLYGRESWSKYLKTYAPEIILLRVTAPINIKLIARKEWRPVYIDDTAVVYVPPPNPTQ